MNLKDRIYQNLVKQLVNFTQRNDTRAKLASLDQEQATIIGSMQTLAEFFKDETGKDLQSELNTNPEWKDYIDRADAEAKKLLASLVIASPTSAKMPQPVASAPAIEAQLPKLRSVGGNKTVIPQPKIVEASAKEGAPKEVLQDRSREPVKIVISDEPAPPPPKTADDMKHTIQVDDDEDGG